MTIPDRRSAVAALRSLDPPIWHLRHSRAVAEIASWLAVRAGAAGIAVDRRLVESAALLHDVDKVLPAASPGGALPHGRASAAWLAARGWPELGPAVEHHPVTILADDATAAWLLDEAPVEVRLVAYADKRAGQRLEPMARRFASWERRYPDGWDPPTRAAVRARATELEDAVCDALRIRPGDVRRQAWTRGLWLDMARTGTAPPWPGGSP
jgi:hypothetical protein